MMNPFISYVNELQIEFTNIIQDAKNEKNKLVNNIPIKFVSASSEY